VPPEPATVLRVDRKRILVDTPGGEALEAQLRGRVAEARGRQTSAVAVGDLVSIERTGPRAAVVVRVEPRRSALYRPEVMGRWRRQVLVANADRAVLCFAHRDPAPSAGLIDRLLVACHGGNVPPLLVFNKSDLGADAASAAVIALYERLGYEVVRTCAATGEGASRLAELLRDRCSVFAGPSGSGKSSLINRVLPGVRLRTGEISATTGKGRHTTTAAELVRIPGGRGHVVDTPGVKEFGLVCIAPRDLELQFPEFPVPAQCRFKDCVHRREPDCTLRGAVEAGRVARTRYDSYLAFLAELEQDERREREG